MSTEEKVALTGELVPRLQRSLYLLRIIACLVAAGLALAKAVLSPPSVAFFLDLFPDNKAGIGAVVPVADLAVSGLLATVLSLVLATFFIQARLQARINADAGALAVPNPETRKPATA